MNHHGSATAIDITSSSKLSSAAGSRLILFFIPGNPGLIEYYREFLALLSKKLEHDHPTYLIHGRSLPNFTNDLGTTLSLKDMIAAVEGNLWQLVQELVNDQQYVGGAKPSLIIIGHSVGAYIGLEIIRRWQTQQKMASTQFSASFDITGFIGLWPTITWISKSSSGVIATFLLNLPGFLPIALALAKLIIHIIPSNLLFWIVRSITRFPDAPAGVTRDFLKSSRGIHQALYMARDEMNEIREDRWSEELWGAASDRHSRYFRMAFHFGAKDHWVADRTRDELIAVRAASGGMDNGRPLMQIDREGIPHAFCIHHGRKTAEITASLIAFLSRPFSGDGLQIAA